MSNMEALIMAEQFINITNMELNLQMWGDKSNGKHLENRNQNHNGFLPTTRTSSNHPSSIIPDIISRNIALDPSMFLSNQPSASFQIGDDDEDDDDDEDLLALELSSEEGDEDEEDAEEVHHIRDPVKHKCKVCLSPVSYATNRKNHVIAHLGLKPWKCPICYKHYTRPHSTALHIAKFHPEQHLTAAPIYDLCAEDAQEVEEKIIEYFPSIKRLPTLGQQTKSAKPRIRRNYRQLEQLPITCQVCHKEIRDTATGKSRHVLTHVHVKPWKCAVCDSYYTRPNLVTPHFARMHPGVTVEQPVYQLSEADELQIHNQTLECFPLNWKKKMRGSRGNQAYTKYNGHLEDPQSSEIEMSQDDDEMESEGSDEREENALDKAARDREESDDKRRRWMQVVERISPIPEDANASSSFPLSPDDQMTLISSRPDSSNTPPSAISEEGPDSFPESSYPSSGSVGTPKLPAALSACKICGKAFGYTSNKKRHVMFHMKLTPYQCPSCNSKFAHITTASKHFNQKHADEEFKPAIYTLTKEDEDLIDESIRKLFPLSSPQPQKISSISSGKRKAREVCQICNKSVIGSATDRKRHVIIHMGIKPWKCVVCDEGFTRQNVAMDHIKKKHPEVQVKKAVSKLSETEETQFQEHLKLCFPDVWTRKNSRIVHTPVHRLS